MCCRTIHALSPDHRSCTVRGYWGTMASAEIPGKRQEISEEGRKAETQSKIRTAKYTKRRGKVEERSARLMRKARQQCLGKNVGRKSRRTGEEGMGSLLLVA